MCASKGAEAFFSKPVEVRQIVDWLASSPFNAAVASSSVPEESDIEPAKRLCSA